MLKGVTIHYSTPPNELRRLLLMTNSQVAYRVATNSLLEHIFVDLINFEVGSLKDQVQVVWRPRGISKERDRELV